MMEHREKLTFMQYTWKKVAAGVCKLTEVDAGSVKAVINLRLYCEIMLLLYLGKLF